MKSKIIFFYSCVVLAVGVMAVQSTTFAGTTSPTDIALLIKQGAQLSTVCSACHGVDGNTVNPNLYPNLAGQGADYIALQLTNFKSGERPNAVMQGFAGVLKKADMQALGAYFAAQTAKHQASADAPLEAKGRLIFTKGSAAGAPACASCHGAQGHGQSVFPRIASQPSAYTLEQLHVYRDAPKFNNPLAWQMKAIAVKVNDDEMRAVSAYLATVK